MRWEWQSNSCMGEAWVTSPIQVAYILHVLMLRIMASQMSLFLAQMLGAAQ